MPLQSSGAISISQIKAELGSSSYSLRTLSAAAGKSTPDAMSEFYGYGNSMILYLNAGQTSSYPGSGTTWYDISGKGNHATLTNRSAANPVWNSTYFTFTPTYVYGTYQYGSYVSLPDGALSSVQSNNRVTMSARIYPTENSYPMIICGNSYNGGIGYQGYQIWIYGTTAYGRITVNNTTTYVDISASLTINAWQHFCITYDGSTATFYKNGSSVGSSSISGTINNISPNRFLIGAQYNAQGGTNTGEMYKGHISHIRVYNQCLSSGDVYNNYTNDMGF